MAVHHSGARHARALTTTTVTTLMPNPTIYERARPSLAHCPSCPFLDPARLVKVGLPGAGCCYAFKPNTAMLQLLNWLAAEQHYDRNKAELAMLLGVTRERVRQCVRELERRGFTVPPMWSSAPSGRPAQRREG